MSKYLTHRTVNPISISVILAIVFASLGLVITPVVTLLNPLNLYYISTICIKRW